METTKAETQPTEGAKSAPPAADQTKPPLADTSAVDSLKAEFAALSKKLDAAERARVAAEKKLSDPEFITAEISKRMGLNKTEDPAALVSGLKAEAAKWQSYASRYAIRSEAMALITDAHVPEDVVKLIDTSGVGIDPATGDVTGLDVLKERVDALRKRSAYMFKTPVDATKIVPSDQTKTAPIKTPTPSKPVEATDPAKDFIRLVKEGGNINEAREALARLRNGKRPALVG